MIITALIFTIVLCLFAARADSANDRVAMLRIREHKQVISLHKWEGTRTFFRRHPWLLRYGPEQQRWVARREARRAAVWVPILQRELAETRAALHPKPTVDSCLRTLIDREGSGWNPHATNPHTGAYGIPQALPGSKMKSAGPDWRDDVATQLRWMVGYVNGRYGGSCAALGHSYSYGWY